MVLRTTNFSTETIRNIWQKYMHGCVHSITYRQDMEDDGIKYIYSVSNTILYWLKNIFDVCRVRESYSFLPFENVYTHSSRFYKNTV